MRNESLKRHAASILELVRKDFSLRIARPRTSGLRGTSPINRAERGLKIFLRLLLGIVLRRSSFVENQIKTLICDSVSSYVQPDLSGLQTAARSFTGGRHATKNTIADASASLDFFHKSLFHDLRVNSRLGFSLLCKAGTRLRTDRPSPTQPFRRRRPTRPPQAAQPRVHSQDLGKRSTIPIS